MKEIYQNYSNIDVIIGDITKEDTINTLFEEIKKHTDKLNLIIHMAGIVEIGSLMEVNITILKNVFEINLFSIYQINQKFFPLLAAAKGIIIHVSSEYGRLLGLPFHSFYTMTKHALEIYNGSLRREIQEFGIKVIKIRT